MKIGFYPGCSLQGSSREYSESLLAVATALGRDLPEVPDWNCCGATAAHNLDPDLATRPAGAHPRRRREAGHRRDAGPLRRLLQPPQRHPPRAAGRRSPARGRSPGMIEADYPRQRPGC